MKDKKLQVFVSSTYTDLKEERQAAVEAILSSGHIPAGMELFTAGDESQMTVIERWIDESDVYLLILGGRYGSVERKTGKSYTHLEYEYALKTKKPSFSVVITNTALDQKVEVLGRGALEQDYPKELKEFIEEVLGSSVVKFWDDPKDIKLAIHETLSEFLYSKNLVGWIRGSESVNTGFLAEEIARLTKENSDLRNQLNTSGSQNTLYCGLTYLQLEKLLQKESVKVNERYRNLFDLLLEYGSEFSVWGKASEVETSILHLLIQFKLVMQEIRGMVGYYYKFTEDGHNFYLKALYNVSEINQ
ncbi:DUF4062 domain-containing protein [Pontibacter litorisediminis]|uniref:DUF4062 domain-containing protein n=1 Tax=Pontibacter litorisediminis TaxID=1846260 RepID=UPI0023EC949D|nr:DUF4062 domain-containing protein [Pontibacter litorisediminis]